MTNIYLGAINICVKWLKKNKYILGNDVQVRRDGRWERTDDFGGKPYVGSCLIFSLAEYGSLFKILQDCEGIATFPPKSFFVINTNSQDNPIFVFVGILFFPSWKEAFRILALLKILQALSRCGSYPCPTLYPSTPNPQSSGLTLSRPFC